jgi:hypothetical protein
MRQQASDRATRARGPQAPTTDGYRPGGAQAARRRRGIRRGLVGVGSIVVLAAIGVGAFIDYDSNAADSASNATTVITKLGASAFGQGGLNPGPPKIVAQATANGPALSTTGVASRQARQPKATNPVVTAQPNMPVSEAGIQGAADPSGQNPPTTLSGFTPKYLQEFTGDSIPPGWSAYSGVPGGESAQTAQWVPSMCAVSGGEMHFMASGVDSCGLNFSGVPQEYGAWFARMKGDDEPSGMSFSDIFLLWPASNQWPPEIDVYEDSGGSRSGTGATVFNTVGSVCGSSPTAQCLAPYKQTNDDSGGAANDGTEWHTYGVEWTPSSITWLIDGHVIYTALASQVKSPAQQPAVPMNMDLQSQNLQGAGTPTSRETMTVDWVEEFSWNG